MCGERHDPKFQTNTFFQLLQTNADSSSSTLPYSHGSFSCPRGDAEQIPPPPHPYLLNSTADKRGQHIVLISRHVRANEISMPA
ncbi:hypothetical protein FQN60_002279 [Etheostoma spectabile]|uniref:Uncharacterized protein n=1 Tax=Etheostoma spectabile TaxID=54343 RepID=A0A5J5DDI9_9PERO|nr:hypothetical protein FQN60_002279 [Etheostoma spectabile]